MNTKFILGSLAQDLYRVGESCHSRSMKTADIFMIEAQKRIGELKNATIKQYLRDHLTHIKMLPNVKNIDKKAEDALMYSTIIQNYCLKYL